MVLYVHTTRSVPLRRRSGRGAGDRTNANLADIKGDYLLDAGSCDTHTQKMIADLTSGRRLCTFPSVATEVLLEGSKLKVLLSQGSYIRLVTHVVEPPVHDGILFTHLLLKLVPRYLVVVNFSPYDAAKGLGYLGHGLLVSGKIYLSPDPLLGMLKGYGCKGPYVLCGYLLERLVRIERLGQGAPKNHLAHPLPVLHKEDRAQDCVGKITLTYMLLDFPLAVEVRDTRLPISTADRTVNEMLHTGYLRRLSHYLALLDLSIIAGLPEVLHGEDPVGSFERLLHSGAASISPSTTSAP